MLDESVTAWREAFEAELRKRPEHTGYLCKRNVPFVRGSRFSCGDSLTAPEYGRCSRFRLAWRLAHRSPVVSAEWADAIDTARFSG